MTFCSIICTKVSKKSFLMSFLIKGMYVTNLLIENVEQSTK